MWWGMRRKDVIRVLETEQREAHVASYVLLGAVDRVVNSLPGFDMEGEMGRIVQNDGFGCTRRDYLWQNRRSIGFAMGFAAAVAPQMNGMLQCIETKGMWKSNSSG
jgi:hypothetical protein